MENENKILSMLETLVNEQQKTNKRLDTIESKVDTLEQEVHTVKSISLSIENEHGNKLQALFDSIVVNNDRYSNHEPRITKLEDTTEHHSLEILALKHK